MAYLTHSYFLTQRIFALEFVKFYKMIQRIQSLYLFLIIISIFLMLFVPLGEIHLHGDVMKYAACDFFQSNESVLVTLMPLCIYLIITMIFTLVVLFQFKKRVFQIKLAKMNGILLAVLIAVIVMSGDFLALDYQYEEDELSIHYGIGTYLSFVPLILNYLAIKRIRKDEELVRSADRLR